MVAVDYAATVRFLRTAYNPDDWIAVFMKAYDTGRVAQRVGSLATFCERRWQTWLAAMHQHRFNAYVAVNAIAPGSQRRTRAAVLAVRHVFLEADRDGPQVLRAVRARSDLPCPSYVLHSSPNRLHLLWRVTGFTKEAVEHLQKGLARELGTDRAATPCTQTTRLPGFWNLKYSPPHLVTVEYGDVEAVYTPLQFPSLTAQPANIGRATEWAWRAVALSRSSRDSVDRARRYLASAPPAISGQHGDVHTFRICCRVVRGFALSDSEALDVLADWNSRCVPPWSERELVDKLYRARKYGQEPFGGLL